MKKLKWQEDSVEKPVAVSFGRGDEKVHQLNSTESKIRTHKTPRGRRGGKSRGWESSKV